MSISKSYLFLFFGIVATMIGCLKPDGLPPEPHILSVSLSRSSLDELDTLTFFIEFEDGDGDIGTDDDDLLEENLWVINQNNGDTSKKIIPYLPPQGNVRSIRGTLEVVHFDCCTNVEGETQCIDGVVPRPDIDEVKYLIQLVDRAGNKSNLAESPSVFIDCKP